MTIKKQPSPDDDTFALRQLCRFRMRQVDSCSNLKRKVIALLDQIFPEYENLFSDVFGMSSRELLRTHTPPEEIASIHTTKLANILARASKGRFGKEKALEIKAVAKQSLGIAIGVNAIAFQLRQIIEQIIYVEEQIKQLDEEIEVYMEALQSPITTLPGPNAVPTYLRRAFWGAAFVASWSDPELKEYYQRIRARGNHHGVAVGAVVRKLCYLLFAVLTENRPYEVRS